MRKYCNKCNIEKDITEFYERKSGRDGYRNDCKSCHSIRATKYYFSHKEHHRKASRRYSLKVEYGMSLEEYEARSQEQKFLCKICGKPQSKERGLAVDHDHQTGEVRGLLCNTCNSALGGFQDDVDLLKRAINYLELYSAKTEGKVDRHDAPSPPDSPGYAEGSRLPGINLYEQAVP